MPSAIVFLRPLGLRLWPVIALVTQLGLTVAGSLVVSLLIGIWLDSTFGPRPLWTLVFALVGIVGATVGVYRMVSTAIAQSTAGGAGRGPTARRGPPNGPHRPGPDPEREADRDEADGDERSEERDDPDEPDPEQAKEDR